MLAVLLILFFSVVVLGGVGVILAKVFNSESEVDSKAPSPSRTAGKIDQSRLHQRGVSARNHLDSNLIARERAVSPSVPPVLATQPTMSTRADTPRPMEPTNKPSVTPPTRTIRWVAPGEPVTVAGYAIPGGMLYVGEDWPAIESW